jgi:hypothetical protein
MPTEISILLLFATFGSAQTYVAQLSGEVSSGEEFRRDIGAGLVFVLKPTDTGWDIGIVPKARCAEKEEEWAWVVNPPYRGYNSLYLDASYGTTASEAVAISPREFSFVVACEDYKLEARRVDIVLWPYNYTQKEADEALAKLGTSALRKAKLIILSSKVSPAEHDIQGKNYGKIDWLKFRLDVTSRPSRGRGVVH